MFAILSSDKSKKVKENLANSLPTSKDTFLEEQFQKGFFDRSKGVQTKGNLANDYITFKLIR